MMNFLFQRLRQRDVILLAVMVFVLDQASKLFMMNFSPEQVIFNEGSAFGLLQGFRWLFVGVSVVVLMFLWTAVHWYSSVEVGLLLGGVAGNMVDRLVFGRVTDFITIGWWPSFNLADGAISCAVILLLSRHALRRREFM